jgi:hypothetical protein
VSPTTAAPKTATQVVTALTGAGYKCAPDVDYTICTTGTTSVWVRTGSHPRPPVVSLHAKGPVATASSDIAKVLPQVLQLAHIDGGPAITTWFGRQTGKTEAQYTAGDWLVEYSAEVASEAPGAHLTLTDTQCKSNCQTE